MLLSNPLADPHGRYNLREFRLSDYVDLCEINEQLFFAPLYHGTPELFLHKALMQQIQGEEQLTLGNACRDEQRRKEMYIAVADPETDRAFGSIMLTFAPDIGTSTIPNFSVEVAYFIHPDYQRIHCATDATIQLLQHCTEDLGLQINLVVATVDPDNIASNRVLDRFGLVVTGYLPNMYPPDPSLPESRDPLSGELIYRPRNVRTTELEALYQRAADITKPDPAIVLEHLVHARAARKQGISEPKNLSPQEIQRRIKETIQAIHLAEAEKNQLRPKRSLGMSSYIDCRVGPARH